MKILVTGGAGFIGSNFIRLVLKKQKNARVLNFDKLTYSGNLDNLKDVSKDARYSFVRGDISDYDAFLKAFKAFKPDYVVNFAAETHVDRSIHGGTEAFLRTNAEGVRVILEVIKKFPVKKFVQVSTDEVYGSLPLSGNKKFTESSPLKPNSPYAATKAAADLLCRAYYSTWKLPIVVTNCSNNFGPYQYPEKLIPFFITKLLAGKKVPLYGDGKNVRDWLYVMDHCEALLLCMQKGQPGETYNIGGGSEFSNHEIAKKLLKDFKKDEGSIEYVADRPGHDRRYAIDSSKIRRELNWKPKHSFENALQETINWYNENQGWLKALLRKESAFNKHLIK